MTPKTQLTARSTTVCPIGQPRDQLQPVTSLEHSTQATLTNWSAAHPDPPDRAVNSHEQLTGRRGRTTAERTVVHVFVFCALSARTSVDQGFQDRNSPKLPGIRVFPNIHGCKPGHPRIEAIHRIAAPPSEHGKSRNQANIGRNRLLAPYSPTAQPVYFAHKDFSQLHSVTRRYSGNQKPTITFCPTLKTAPHPHVFDSSNASRWNAILTHIAAASRPVTLSHKQVCELLLRDPLRDDNAALWPDSAPPSKQRPTHTCSVSSSGFR